MKRGPAGVTEIVEWGPRAEEDPRDVWLTGTFEAWHQDPENDWASEKVGPLDLESALAWALERSENVIVSIDRQSWSAGAEADGNCAPWPPEELPPARRRRRAGFEWMDRPETAKPVVWPVEVTITPLVTAPDLIGQKRELDRAVEAARAAPRVHGACWVSDGASLRVLLDVEAVTLEAAQLAANAALGEPFAGGSRRSFWIDEPSD